MVRDAAERVSALVQQRVGRGLRTVVVVGPTDWEITYLRDDLEAEYTEETFGTVVETFRMDSSIIDPDVDAFPIGQRRAVVHYHEHAFVLQFVFSDTETILISIEPDVGRDLLDFIEECRKTVHEEA